MYSEASVRVYIRPTPSDILANVTKRLIDVDDQALEAARRRLHTTTIKDTVNEALRLAAATRRVQLDAALAALAEAELDDRSAPWR